MRKLFLGKPWHWALFCTLTGLLWWAGTAKLHVIHFNSFLLVLSLGSLALVVLVVRTTKPEEQVTREKLDEGKSDNAGTE